MTRTKPNRLPIVTPRDVHSHFETCDASAAVALGQSLFIVGNDEDNTLRVYQRDRCGRPVAKASFSKDLGVADKREVDIEAATWLGSKIFWIGSFDRKGKGARHRLFANKISFENGRLKIDLWGKPYEDLLQDVIKDVAYKRFDLAAAAKVDPRTEGGLCIEGLARGPDRSLLIGLRNPIPDGMALIVQLMNPEKVVKHGRSGSFDDPIELDLGGLGIRSLERIPSRDSYLIAAGPFDKAKDYRLFEWTGKRDDTPVPLLQFDPDWNIEALLAFPDEERSGAYHDELLVMSDDGKRQIEGFNCNDLPKQQRRFRSGTIWLSAE